MKVLVPGPLRDYTRGKAELDLPGGTLTELLGELDSRFPGIRFRIIDEQEQVRTHIKVFVNTRQVKDLATALAPGDEVMIVCALSGG